MKIGITFGTFDVSHGGRLRTLGRAREHCDRLIAGASSDELNFPKKGRTPYHPREDRSRTVGALRVVDEVFNGESPEEKREYLPECKAGILIMGDGWAGGLDWARETCGVPCLPRAPSISTTALIGKIRA